MSRDRVHRPTLGPSALLHPPEERRVAAPGRAEAQFYAKQIEAGTAVTVRLRDGEELTGVIDWYDRSSLRLNLAGGQHRIVQKTAIRTIARTST